MALRLGVGPTTPCQTSNGQGGEMPVNEETRHEVYEAFKASHGPNIAGARLEMLPPAGVPELATKADLAVLEAKLSAVESRLAGRIEGVRAEMQKELRALGNRFIGWMFAAAGLSLAVAGAVAGLG